MTFAPLSAGALIALLSALVLLYISGLVSASEIAFFSLTPSEKEEVEEEDHPSDRRVRSLLDDSERLFATILISNNFANVAVAVLLNYFFVTVVDFGSAKALEFVAVAVVLVFLLLLFGEIMPKIYSTQHSLAFVRRAAPMMCVLRSLSVRCRLFLSVLLLSSTRWLSITGCRATCL